MGGTALETEETATTTSNKRFQPSPAPVAHREEQPNRACLECHREARTYLVELTNCPALQNGRVRAGVLGKGEYDAVLLVYDVGSRASFDSVPGLAGEVPLYGRRRGMKMRRGGMRQGLSGMMTNGDGGNHAVTGEKHGRRKLKRRRSTVAVGMNTGMNRASSSMSFRRNHRHGPSNEPVVALVGNKADLDAEYASVEFGLEAKRAALEEVGVEERGLMHPLYRESQLYRDGTDGRDDFGVVSGIPELRSKIGSRPRPVKSHAASAGSIRTLLSPYSGRSFVSDGHFHDTEAPNGARDAGVNEEWPLMAKLAETDKEGGDTSKLKLNNTARPATRTRANHSNIDSAIRRSAVSADYHLLSNNRTSILSKRSVRTMQEGSKPLVLAKLPKSEAVENWIRTGSPTTAEHPDEETVDDDSGADEDYHQHCAEGRGRSYSTTTTAALSRRQVSRVEGEILARALMLDVPLYETSAKTGENVEEMFEAVVTEVLRKRGIEAVPDEVVNAECRGKHGKKGPRKGGAMAPSDSETVVGKRITEDRALDENAKDGEMPAVDAELQEMTLHVSSTDISDSRQRTADRRRRWSMLDRFRMVFTRGSVVMVEDLAG